VLEDIRAVRRHRPPIDPRVKQSSANSGPASRGDFDGPLRRASLLQRGNIVSARRSTIFGVERDKFACAGPAFAQRGRTFIYETQKTCSAYRRLIRPSWQFAEAKRGVAKIRHAVPGLATVVPSAPDRLFILRGARNDADVAENDIDATSRPSE